MTQKTLTKGKQEVVTERIRGGWSHAGSKKNGGVAVPKQQVWRMEGTLGRGFGAG
jgi:hypothetical protein